jgi:hypothetical protein
MPEDDSMDGDLWRLVRGLQVEDLDDMMKQRRTETTDDAILCKRRRFETSDEADSTRDGNPNLKVVACKTCHGWHIVRT